MSQKRLNALTILSIENNFSRKLDYTCLIDLFTSKIARRAMFKWYLLVNVILSSFCDFDIQIVKFFYLGRFVSFEIVAFL